MEDAELRSLERRADALEAAADRAGRAALELEAVAEAATGRLDPALEMLLPPVWAGRAADEARRAASSAGEDLRRAAAWMLELAAEIHADADVARRLAASMRPPGVRDGGDARRVPG